MDLQQIVAKLQAEALRLAERPEAVPAAWGLAGVLLVIVVFYAVSKSSSKAGQRKGQAAGPVRRSTR